LKRYVPGGLPDRSSGSAGEVETRRVVAEIVASVELRGRAAVLDCRQRFDGVDRDRPLLVDRSSWQAAVSELRRQQPELLAVLRSRHENIATFARAQRAALLDVDIAVPGGRAGHVFAPVARAGCYAPGGRYPLPSSVLMTVATARAAGVIDVTLATPNVSAVMLAAAEIAGATRVLHCGGAQAIAAMAFGVAGEAERVPAADVIVGPGNKYVTEAKRLLSGRVGIDMLAGPSEVLIVAVPEAGYAVDAGVIAADMLAQAEHDADAAAILVTTDAGLVDRVEIQLGLQLADLPTAVTARQAIANSFAVVCASRAECLDVSGRLAPEHLELFTADAAGDLGNVASYGGAFVGSA